MAGSGLPGRLPLIFRFSRSASLPDGRAWCSPVNLLSRAGTFILVNRRKINLFVAVHALSFPGLNVPVHLHRNRNLPGYYIPYPQW
jgi:hypothetical protein